MSHHFLNQRKQNRKLLALQLVITVGVCMVLVALFGTEIALAFGIGAAVFSLAHFVMAWILFVGTYQAAIDWLIKLYMAVVIKWLLVFVLMWVFMKRLAIAPLASIGGIVFSMLVIQLFTIYEAKVKRVS